MNNDDMHPDKTEALLKAVAPYLAASKAPPVEPPLHVLARLKNSLKAKFSKGELLSVKDMQLLILKLLSRQPMDGFEMTTRLEEKRITLDLPGAGDAAIYGLLGKLESSGLVETERKEVKGELLTVYIITDSGRAKCQEFPSEQAKIIGLVNTILSVEVGTSGISQSPTSIFQDLRPPLINCARRPSLMWTSSV